jgi:hypothetical protein
MTHTLTEVRDIAARLLADKGIDYVYPSKDNPESACLYYTTDGQPSCFVGHVLDIWQEGVDVAKRADAFLIEEGDGASALSIINDAGIDIEPSATEYLTAIQDWQDIGNPWGKAVLHAEHHVGLHTEYVPGCADCDGE